MNKTLKIFFLSLAWLSSVAVYAQEKKPTLMILPSDNWCSQRYFIQSFFDQGREVRVCDYARAFQEDTEIGPVISLIGQIMTEHGYSLKDSEQELKNLSLRAAEDGVTMNKSGSQLAESPLDILKKRSRSDIIIQIGWQVNKEHKGKSITYTMEAFDSYTSKRIATSTGTSKASNDIIPKMLANAVNKQITTFDQQLVSYFNSLKKNGREIILTIKCWESWDKNLESDYKGEELLDYIQKWLKENTVNGNFNLSDATENIAQFEQVRIPLINEMGIAIDARAFATGLRKYLHKEPFEITSKVITRGLGEAILVLGEK